MALPFNLAIGSCPSTSGQRRAASPRNSSITWAGDVGLPFTKAHEHSLISPRRKSPNTRRADTLGQVKPGVPRMPNDTRSSAGDPEQHGRSLPAVTGSPPLSVGRQQGGG
jgi:hypothetical protein